VGGVSKCMNARIHRCVRGCGAARPQTIFATVCSHVHVADKLSGPELKSEVWVGYYHE